MSQEIQPDLERFVGPFRRHWAALSVAFGLLLVVFVALFGSVLESSRHETTVVIETSSRVTRLELAAVLPSALTPIVHPPLISHVEAFYAQDDLLEDLLLADTVEVNVGTPKGTQLELHVSAPSGSQTRDALQTLISGYERKRLLEVEEISGEAAIALGQLLEVTEAELAALADISEALEQRSALTRERVALVTAQDLLEEFLSNPAIGVEFDVVNPVTAVPSSRIASGALAFTAAVMMIGALGLIIGVFDGKVRTRNDLLRLAPGGEVVGLIGAIHGPGVVAVARGLLARSITGDIQVVGTFAGVAGLADAIGAEISNSGAANEVLSFETPEQFEVALRGAADAAATLLVVDWGGSERKLTRLRYAQLNFAGADRVGLVFRGVPDREVEATFR